MSMPDKPASREEIDTTRASCPQCLETVPTKVVIQNGRVHLEKSCPEHGTSSVLMSEHPDFYRKLRADYYSVVTESFPQNNFYLQLDFKCNLRCPICLDSAGETDVRVYTVQEVKDRFKNISGKRICIFGGEPTEFEELPEVIRYLKEKGNRTSVATNGIRIAEIEYLKKLKEAGLDELRIALDGFREETNIALRGRKLTETRLKAIRNAEQLNMNINLLAVISPGLNEDEIGPLLDFAVRRERVKELFLLGIRSLGRGNNLSHEKCFLPDQVIDAAQKATGERVTRKDVFQMQRLMYLFYGIFKIRQCFYNQFLVLLRDGKGGFWTFNQIVDMPRLQKKIDRTYRLLKKGKRRAAAAHLFAAMALCSLNPRAIRAGLGLAKMLLLAAVGWNASKLPPQLLVMGFVGACDRYIFDERVQSNCAIGAFCADERYAETQESSAAFALQQEKLALAKAAKQKSETDK